MSTEPQKPHIEWSLGETMRPMPRSVRLSRYRHPYVPAEIVCPVCGYTMHHHFWIDGLPGAEVVCPVITAPGSAQEPADLHVDPQVPITPDDVARARAALAFVDAADRAAGVIRVRTDEQVEKLARVIFAACYPDDPFHQSQFDQQNQPRQELHRRQARAVLEALVTP